MASDLSHFSITYDGAVSTDGKMNARVFASSVEGLDQAYRDTVLALGAQSTDGLQIETHIERGCVIINFLASDEFRHAMAPLVKSKEAIDVLKSVLDAIASSIDIAVTALTPIVLAVVRGAEVKRRVEMHELTSQIKREKLKQEEITTERMRIGLEMRKELASEGQQHLSDAARSLLINSKYIEQIAPSIGLTLLPLVTGEATSISVGFDNADSVAAVTAAQLMPAVEKVSEAYEYERRVAAAKAPNQRRNKQDRPNIQEGIVGFLAVRYDKGNTQWRVILDGHEYPASVNDRAFLNSVAQEEDVVRPSDRFQVSYTESHLARGVRIDISSVKSRIMRLNP